jgi:hypothetical protein
LATILNTRGSVITYVDNKSQSRFVGGGSHYIASALQLVLKKARGWLASTSPLPVESLTAVQNSSLVQALLFTRLLRGPLCIFGGDITVKNVFQSILTFC